LIIILSGSFFNLSRSFLHYKKHKNKLKKQKKNRKTNATKK
jgi:hypothetical protein